MEQNTNTEISIYQKMADPLKAVETMGGWIAKSGMFNCEKMEQGNILALAMMAEGKTPLHFLQKHHIINGKLAMRSDYMLGEFARIGGKHEILKRDSDGASVKLTLDGKSQVFTLLWKDAQLEPFTQGKNGIAFNYSTPVKRMQMLWARVTSDAVRAVAPGIVAGILTPEEIADFGPQPEKQINLAPVPPVVEPTKTEPVDVVSKVVPMPTPVSKTAPPEDEKELAAAGLSPVQPPPHAPAPLSDSHVTDEMVEDTYNALAGNFMPALRWMVREKWLKIPTSAIEGEDAAGIYIRDNLKTVASVRVRKLLKNTASFLTAIKGAA